MRNRHFKVFTLGPTFLILKETVFLSLCVCWGGGGCRSYQLHTGRASLNTLTSVEMEMERGRDELMHFRWTHTD